MKHHCECGRRIRVPSRRGWRRPDRHHDLCGRCWRSLRDASRARQITATRHSPERHRTGGKGR